MARYIEREKFLKKCAKAWGYAGVTIKAIEQIADECTTADVVPKSEVDGWREVAETNMLVILNMQNELTNAKAEVAREIFEEIEKYLVTGTTIYGQRIYAIGVGTFAELKKKYTEGET